VTRAKCTVLKIVLTVDIVFFFKMATKNHTIAVSPLL